MPLKARIASKCLIIPCSPLFFRLFLSTRSLRHLGSKPCAPNPVQGGCGGGFEPQVRIELAGTLEGVCSILTIARAEYPAIVCTCTMHTSACRISRFSFAWSPGHKPRPLRFKVGGTSPPQPKRRKRIAPARKRIPPTAKAPEGETLVQRRPIATLEAKSPIALTAARVP